MIRDQYISDITLFFYLAFVNSALSYRATKKVVRELSKIKKEEHTQELVVKLCVDYFLAHYQERVQFVPDLEKLWIVDDRVNMTIWREYQKTVDKNHMISLIWSLILSYPEVVISKALNLTSGTVQYRVAKGIKSLAYYSSFGEYELI